MMFKDTDQYLVLFTDNTGVLGRVVEHHTGMISLLAGSAMLVIPLNNVKYLIQEGGYSRIREGIYVIGGDEEEDEYEDEETEEEDEDP